MAPGSFANLVSIPRFEEARPLPEARSRSRMVTSVILQSDAILFAPQLEQRQAEQLIFDAPACLQATKKSLDFRLRERCAGIEQNIFEKSPPRAGPQPGLERRSEALFAFHIEGPRQKARRELFQDDLPVFGRGLKMRWNAAKGELDDRDVEKG